MAKNSSPNRESSRNPAGATSGNGGEGMPPAPIQPWIRVADVRKALEFYTAMGFSKVFELPNPDGTIARATIQTGTSLIGLSPIDIPQSTHEKREALVRKGPRGVGVTFYTEVDDVAEAHTACKKAGLEFTSNLRDEFWGARVFSCIDPFGYEWMFGQTTKHMSPDEVVAAARQH